MDAGVKHPFGAPTGYEVVHGGRRYPPKAVIGLAHRHLAGRLLRPEEFSDGEAPGQANYVLRELGFAVEVERRRLLEAGRDDLAARVEWIAETYGDGLGFDVLSLDGVDDSEWWIEVKTTGLGKHFPFYVSANEVRCSEDCPERFRLYRVFDFARQPRVYVVGGALSRECRLEAVEYRVSV